MERLWGDFSAVYLTLRPLTWSAPGSPQPAPTSTLVSMFHRSPGNRRLRAGRKDVFFLGGGILPGKDRMYYIVHSELTCDTWLYLTFGMSFCKCIDHWVPVGGFASRLGDIGNHRCPQLSWKVLKKSQTRFTCNANMHVYVLKNIWLYIHLVSVEFEWVFK